MSKPIFVVGGTGTVGSALVRDLVRRGCRVHALARSPGAAGALRAVGVEAVLGDLDNPANLRAELEGIERAFLLTAPRINQVAQQTAFLDAARDAGVRHVVKLSVVGASADSPLRLGRDHRAIESHLEASGMTWTHLRAQSFMQNLLASAAVIANQGALYAPAGDGQWPLVDARDVAAVAAAVLTGDGHGHQALEITGPEAITHHQMAEALGAAIGRPVRYVDVPPETARAGMLAAGLPDWLVDDLVTIAQSVARGHGGEPTDTVRRLTGREATSFVRWARDYADLFRGGNPA